MTALFNLAASLIREASITAYERRAARQKSLIVLCAICGVFMTERPDEDGRVERSLCAACVPAASDRVN